MKECDKQRDSNMTYLFFMFICLTIAGIFNEGYAGIVLLILGMICFISLWIMATKDKKQEGK